MKCSDKNFLCFLKSFYAILDTGHVKMPKEKAAEAAFFVGNVFSKEFRSRNGSLFKRYIHVAFFHSTIAL